MDVTAAAIASSTQNGCQQRCCCLGLWDCLSSSALFSLTLPTVWSLPEDCINKLSHCYCQQQQWQHQYYQQQQNSEGNGLWLLYLAKVFSHVKSYQFILRFDWLIQEFGALIRICIQNKEELLLNFSFFDVPEKSKIVGYLYRHEYPIWTNFLLQNACITC